VIKTPTKRKAEDVFGDSSPAVNSPSISISREAFLANEALRRQREARNFKYKGDANAPRHTRSGRVVVDATNGDEVDEFGGDDTQLAVDEEVGEELEIEKLDDGGAGDIHVDNFPALDLPSNDDPPVPQISPLSPYARQHLTNVLATITSQHVSTDPTPFRNEDRNEALQGLLKLLQGTVDRGEGNSALVTGPRGAGKTRVS
jgi:origin recognition complex subunit 4